jgi:hypothetical protein
MLDIQRLATWENLVHGGTEETRTALTVCRAR